MKLGAVQRFGVCLALVWMALGCGKSEIKGPETVPFQGKVEVAGGGTPQDLANRSVGIMFQSVEQPDINAFGAILEDGSFTMATQVEGKSKPGVVAGTHRVRIFADEAAERFVSRKFFKFETSGLTAKAPPEGEVVIKVHK